MSLDKKDQLISLLRSIMYGTSDMLQEAYAVGELLADIDGVSADANRNRLIRAARLLKNSYQQIDHINEDALSDEVL